MQRDGIIIIFIIVNECVAVFLCVFCISGDTGPNLLEWVRFLLGKDMQFEHVKMVFPTAPSQPYTPMGGEVCVN